MSLQHFCLHNDVTPAVCVCCIIRVASQPTNGCDTSIFFRWHVIKIGWFSPIVQLLCIQSRLKNTEIGKIPLSMCLIGCVIGVFAIVSLVRIQSHLYYFIEVWVGNKHILPKYRSNSPELESDLNSVTTRSQSPCNA